MDVYGVHCFLEPRTVQKVAHSKPLDTGATLAFKSGENTAFRTQMNATPASDQTQGKLALGEASYFFSLIRSVIVLGVAAFCMSRPVSRLDASGGRVVDGLPNFPRLVLWAWERPEDFTFLDKAGQPTGVAFLARTLYLREGDVIVRPRLQPLRIPPQTALMAVVRIEPKRDGRLTLSDDQASHAAEEIATVAQLPRVTALQVDFDAVRSEREFYRQLLQHLRDKVPRSVTISITALASWCMDDDWITGLPVDEAVPMLFRMGVDRGNVLAFLSNNSEFKTGLCRQSLGISTDEPLSNLPKGKRIYVFNNRSWSARSLAAVRQEVADVQSAD